MRKLLRTVNFLSFLGIFTFIFSCDDTTSLNDSSENDNTTTITQSDVLGKWILVGSDYLYNPSGANLKAKYWTVTDTSELIIVTEKSTTFYLKNSGSFNKVVTSFSYNNSSNYGYKGFLRGDTLVIRYTEDEGGSGYEYESKFFLPFTGDIPPANWPTKEEPFDGYLFL